MRGQSCSVWIRNNRVYGEIWKIDPQNLYSDIDGMDL
jgi:hypothetical protein